MRITLVRHGESEGNVGHIISDDPNRPVHLTEKGLAQAEKLAGEIAAEDFTHAYVSQFHRAQETMTILLRGRNIPLQIDARLNERKSGMDGQPVSAFNDQVRRDPLNFKTAQGETFLEEMARLRSFLDEIAARHPDGQVLAVSHQDPILAAKGLTTSAQEVVLEDLPNCGRITLTWPRR